MPITFTVRLLGRRSASVHPRCGGQPQFRKLKKLIANRSGRDIACTVHALASMLSIFSGGGQASLLTGGSTTELSATDACLLPLPVMT